MEGLEQLKQDVLRQAKAEALKIREEGEKEVTAYLKEKKDVADKLYAAALSEGKLLQQKQKAQKNASLLMKERQAILEIKQDLIAKTLDELYCGLLSMSVDQKLRFYQKLLKLSYEELPKENTTYFLKLPLEDRELFQDLKMFFTKEYSSELDLVIEAYPSRLGFELSQGDIHITQGLDRLFEDEKEAWTTQIATIFFGI